MLGNSIWCSDFTNFGEIVDGFHFRLNSRAHENPFEKNPSDQKIRG